MSIHIFNSARHGAAMVPECIARTDLGGSFVICAGFRRKFPVGGVCHNPDLAGESSCGIDLPHLGVDGETARVTSRAGRTNSVRDNARNMADSSSTGLTRRGLLAAFAATAVTAAPTFSNAAGFLRGGGDIRRIRMYSGRTGERLDMIYWIDGHYIKDAVKEVNHFMRDWRTDQVKSIDLRTIDIMAASHNLLDVNEPYMLLSGWFHP